MADLWRHQAAALEHTLERGIDGTLLAMDMGTGKTRVAVEALRELASEGYAIRALVICPKAVIQTWQRELTYWWPEGDPLAVIARKGKTEADVKALLRADAWDNHYAFVVNYESVARVGKMREAVERVKWDAIICDEAHRLKAHNGTTSRWIAALVKRQPSAVRIALTGTPLPHNHLDAFGLMRFVNPEVFGDSFYRFRSRYTRPAEGWAEYHDPSCIKTKDRNDIIGLMPNRLGELAVRMAPATFRVDAREVIDLPEVVEQTVTAALPRDGVKAYRAMERDFVAKFESGELATASNAAVAVMRLQQIANGVTRDTDTGRPLLVHSAKEDVLVDLLRDLPPRPVVVFCRFIADIGAVGRAAEEAGREHEALWGERNGIEAWREMPAGVLAVQVQAGGVGIDLTNADTMIWFARPWSLGQYDQAKARLVRPLPPGAVDRRGRVLSIVIDSTVDGGATIDGAIGEALKYRETSTTELVRMIAEGS